MHELGMWEAIMDTVERRAAGREVDAIRLRVGVLHRVVPSAFDQAFEMVAMGTVAEGAAVDLVSIPVEVRCPDCGHVEQADEAREACSSCGGVHVDLAGGDELTLESLRLASQADETPRPAEAAPSGDAAQPDDHGARG